MAEAVVLAYGNRLEEIKDGNDYVIGYRLWTGSEGEETLEASECADDRQLELYLDDYPGMRAVPRDFCARENEEDWDAWKIIQIIDEQPQPTQKQPAARQKQPAVRKRKAKA